MYVQLQVGNFKRCLSQKTKLVYGGLKRNLLQQSGVLKRYKGRVLRQQCVTWSSLKQLLLAIRLAKQSAYP